MDEKLKAQLNKGKTSPFTVALLEHCRNLVDRSRRVICKKYDQWDHYDEIYRGIHYPDKQDRKAADKGEPAKMVVPIAFAQIQTFIAFCMMLFSQKERFYELNAMEPGDEMAKELAEALLERDLQESQFPARLYQLLLDLAKFGLGVLKHGWVKEEDNVWGKEPVLDENGQQIGETFKYVRQVKFQGNRVYNVSPYRFFYDTSLPVSRFQEGEFCASEDEISIIELKRREARGEIAGVSQIEPLKTPGDPNNQRIRRLSSEDLLRSDTPRGVGQSVGTAVVTEVQVWLIPSEFEVEEGVKLGKEDFPVLYVVEYANDETLLRVEPMGYAHNQFTYDVAEFSPDQHHILNAGMSEMIDMLQATMTWFINSHVSNVRQVIQNRLVIDPTGLEMADVKENRPYIRLNQAAAGGDVRAYVQQLQVSDVTGNHMKDAETLSSLIQIVTGISENALGQYASGRRSATESRNVNLGAASRPKTIAGLIYTTCLQPLGKKLLSNLRDGLDVETYVRVRGQSSNPREWQAFKVTRDQLVGNYDFSIFDMTLPSEKGYVASQLQELLSVVLSNPEAAITFGYDPKALLDEMFRLRGLRNLEQFKLSYDEQLQLIGASAAAGAAANPPAQGPAGPTPAPVGGQPPLPVF